MSFTDQEIDAETGLYNYDARLYDPVIGRFISADTEVPEPFNPQSLNRYTYCLNNPIIYIDPSGHFWEKTDDGYREVVGPPEPRNIKRDRALDEIDRHQNSNHDDPGNLGSIETISNKERTGNAEADAQIELDNLVSMYNEAIKANEGYNQLGFWGKIGFHLRHGHIFSTRVRNNLMGSLYVESGLEVPVTMGTVEPPVFSAGKIIRFGKLKVLAEKFHRQIKPSILQKAGKYKHRVGKNPDVKIVGDKIQLTGAKSGPFKGKTMKTDLKVSDFF